MRTFRECCFYRLLEHVSTRSLEAERYRVSDKWILKEYQHEARQLTRLLKANNYRARMLCYAIGDNSHIPQSLVVQEQISRADQSPVGT